MTAQIQTRRPISIYVELTKLRIMFLLNFVAVGGVVAASGGFPITSIANILIAGSLAAGGSSAINSYLDRDIDAKMPRTNKRPIPIGYINPPEKALWFGLSLLGLGLVFSVFVLPLLSTLFIALGAFTYVVVYTMWLKRRHPSNIVIGGAAGSFATLAGWASVSTGSPFLGIFMALLIFIWTPSHFWCLAIKLKDSYRKVKIPMLPSVVPSEVAARYILINSVFLVAISVIPFFFSYLGAIYLIIALIFGALLLWGDMKLLKNPSSDVAWKAYKFSSPYLAIVFIGIMVDVVYLA
ncbi:MAG: heme o synthase [Nitrososphaerales archaeon]